MERCEPFAVNWPKFEALAGKNRNPSETLLKGTFRCSLMRIFFTLKVVRDSRINPVFPFCLVFEAKIYT